MKAYLRTIKYAQEILLWISVATILVLPVIFAFYPNIISENLTLKLYSLSHLALFSVMVIRPLADILPEMPQIRPLVILRKGAGVFSAAIIVSFIFAKLMIDPMGYLGSIFTLPYWSLVNYAALAHLGDLSAIILLITSNNYSKRILGSWWKKIQRLSYVYFYASALYVFFVFGSPSVVIYMAIVTTLTLIAFVKNRHKRKNLPKHENQ